MESWYKIFFALSAETKQMYFNTVVDSPTVTNSINFEIIVDSDKVFYLTVSDTSII